MKPIPDTITREHRTKLLTRRVRAVMRAFNKNPNYLNMIPDITWDDSFIPPELYDETELASLDTEESQQVQKEKEREKEKEKARESQSQNMEEQTVKEWNNKGKAKEKSQDKEKAKETAQEKEKPNDVEKRKRKCTRRTSEINPFDISDDEDGTTTDEAEPPAKRVKRKKSIDDIPVPPPCRRCTKLHKECKPNGRRAACHSCRNAKLLCSLTKAWRPPLIKSIAKQDDKSLIEDEDVDQLDEDPQISNIQTTNHPSPTTINGFILNDPKVRL